MAVLLQDSFDRANSTTTVGAPEVGGPYTVMSGTWGISNNQLYTSAASEADMSAPGARDIDFSTTVAAAGNVGLIFRVADVNNMWLANFTTTGASLWRRNNSASWTQFGSSNATTTALDVMRVVTLGRYIWVFRNNVLLMEAEDPWTTGTGLGFRIYNTTAARLNDATAQDNTVVPVVDGSLAALAPDDRFAAASPTPSAAFVYKGRDYRSADEGAVA